MEVSVITGKLTYFNTSEGVIHITDKEDETYAVISFKTENNSIDFERFIGKDIEALLIDGEIKEFTLASEK